MFTADLFISILKDFGFPVAICFLLFWFLNHLMEKYMENELEDKRYLRSQADRAFNQFDKVKDNLETISIRLQDLEEVLKEIGLHADDKKALYNALDDVRIQVSTLTETNKMLSNEVKATIQSISDRLTQISYKLDGK